MSRASRTSADRSKLSSPLVVVPEEGAREKEGFFCFLALPPPMLPVRGEAKDVIFFIPFYSVWPAVRGVVVGRKVSC